MVSKLKAHEQNFSMRMDDATECAFQVRHKVKQPVQKMKIYEIGGDQKGKGKKDGGSAESATRNDFPPCFTCKRTNHLSKDCWYKGKP